MGFFSKEQSGTAMTPRQLLRCLQSHAHVECIDGQVIEFTWQEMDLILVYDTDADRTRIMAPINAVAELDPQQLRKALQANFHDLFDVRYAISDSLVWSVFMHPLSSLTDELLLSAIKQVVTAKLSFGSDYQSGLEDSE